MKPDKIYIQPNAHDRWFEGNKPNDNFVEYIRKDALVPDNLAEAQFNYVKSLENAPADQGEELMICEAFKAGAEWMAGQGYTVDGAVICDKELTRGYKDIAMSIPDELKVDDKVTIQIRKRQ